MATSPLPPFSSLTFTRVPSRESTLPTRVPSHEPKTTRLSSSAPSLSSVPVPLKSPRGSSRHSHLQSSSQSSPYSSSHSSLHSSSSCDLVRNVWNDSLPIIAMPRSIDSERFDSKPSPGATELGKLPLSGLLGLVKGDNGREASHKKDWKALAFRCHSSLFIPDPDQTFFRDLLNNELQTEAIFKGIRHRPDLIEFLNRIPKIELHAHLTGSIYGEQLWELAIKHNLFFDPETALFHKTATSTTIPAVDLNARENAERRSTWHTKFLEHTCMKGQKELNGNKHFFRCCTWGESVTKHVPLEELLCIFVKNALAQNICYAEVMIDFPFTAKLPKTFANIYQPNLQGFTEALAFLRETGCLSAYAEEHSKALFASEQEVARTLSSSNVPSERAEMPVEVKYQVEVMRDLPNDQFFAVIAAAMTLTDSNPAVVGINLVGPEDHSDSIRNFSEQMQILKFLHKEFGGRPNISLHAGELPIEGSIPGIMSNRIKDSIEIGQAKRIGHGVSLVHEKSPSGTLAIIREKNVCIEICMSSNEHILGLTASKHPIQQYLEMGVPVTLNTDDEGINRSNLTHEFALAVESYKLPYSQAKQFVIAAAEHAFVPGESVSSDSLKHILHEEHISTSQPRGKQEVLSPKVKLQLKVARAFAKFEAGKAKKRTS